jgi:hypothetical protein
MTLTDKLRIELRNLCARYRVVIGIFETDQLHRKIDQLINAAKREERMEYVSVLKDCVNENIDENLKQRVKTLLERQ